MDSFISLAKQGYDTYERSQGNSNAPDDEEERVTKTGGQEYNSPHHRSGGGSGPPPLDEEEVVNRASSHGSGDSSLFSSALSHINSDPRKHHEPIDEEGATEAHRKIYQEGSSEGVNASSMGSAAALQVLKKFSGGGGGGNSQSDMISLAMAEASKLFDKSGGPSSGSKQDVVNSAGMTIMKMMVQSKLGGGSNSGGLGGLMSMAGKFM